MIAAPQRTQLCEIGSRHKTDKAQHGYTVYYDRLFSSIHLEPIKILEIGIYRGSSIRMWEEYFPQGTIVAIDNGRICPSDIMAQLNSRPRVHVENMDQSNPDDLDRLIELHGSDYDIIIDDGHHFQKHQQVSWGKLFPHVKPGGIYVIEDVIIPMNSYHAGMPADQCWGITDHENYSDTTWNILLELIQSRPDYNFNSPYMTDEQQRYIIDNIARTNYGLDLSVVTNGTACFSYMRKKA